MNEKGRVGVASACSAAGHSCPPGLPCPHGPDLWGAPEILCSASPHTAVHPPPASVVPGQTAFHPPDLPCVLAPRALHAVPGEDSLRAGPLPSSLVSGSDSDSHRAVSSQYEDSHDALSQPTGTVPALAANHSLVIIAPCHLRKLRPDLRDRVPSSAQQRCS